MKSTSTAPLLLAAALACSMPSSASAISWSLSSSSCDGSPFSTSGIKVQCNGSSSCGLGDTAIVSGTMTASRSFDDDSHVTLQACVSSYCPEVASKGAGNLCDDWVSPTGGQNCGESGTYSVYHTEDIPDSSDVPSGLTWFVQSMITVNMKVGDEEECQGTGGYQMSYSMFGIASLAIVGAAYAARKRRCGGDAEKDDEKKSPFVEMTDSAIV
ncbi:hypothetical protein ACHAXR_007211 [Thalassiosira sp. AJA248-18]